MSTDNNANSMESPVQAYEDPYIDNLGSEDAIKVLEKALEINLQELVKWHDNIERKQMAIENNRLLDKDTSTKEAELNGMKQHLEMHKEEYIITLMKVLSAYSRVLPNPESGKLNSSFLGNILNNRIKLFSSKPSQVELKLLEYKSIYLYDYKLAFEVQKNSTNKIAILKKYVSTYPVSDATQKIQEYIDLCENRKKEVIWAVKEILYIVLAIAILAAGAYGLFVLFKFIFWIAAIALQKLFEIVIALLKLAVVCTVVGGIIYSILLAKRR